MKKIDIVSATPDLLKSPFSGSIMKRALDSGLVDINFHDLKDYSISVTTVLSDLKSDL